jgi:PLP dependent protein
MSLKENFTKIKKECSEASAKLLVVTKNQKLDDVEALYHMGQRDFAENRVQDLVERYKFFRKKGLVIKWHLIGHVQSNKIAKLQTVEDLVAIHSIDDLALWQTFHQKWQGKRVNLYLQVNTSKEEEKSGIESPSELATFIQWIKDNPHPKLRLTGLMTMATLRTDEPLKAAQSCFSALKEMRNQYFHDGELSMGMSQDYQVALKLGASIVRVGSKIFNP